jgi:multiple sugar transport system ATP-binding protein
MAQIRLVNLCKRYETGIEAVSNLNLDFQEGEFVVLVGPSGCGKTTTLRLIAGLEEVSSGEIYLGNRVVNQLESDKRDLAMVFQNYALYPSMSVRENLSFGLRMRKTPKQEIERRITEAASILSLDSLLDRQPEELSGGQRQRVALGRAIVRQPQAFLFDEPLSNLDATLRSQMRTELTRLHQRFKTTTIYVTHDQVEALTLGDRIVVMKDGIVQQADTPMKVYHYPANQFVAGFIGSPAMNFVAGKVQSGIFFAPGIQYPLTPATHAAASRVVDGPVILGCRPETLTLEENEPLFSKVKLEVVERLGYETLAYFSLGQGAEKMMVARFNGKSAVRTGDEISLHLRRGEWHLFSTVENELKQRIRL